MLEELINLIIFSLNFHQFVSAYFVVTLKVCTCPKSAVMRNKASKYSNNKFKLEIN